MNGIVRIILGFLALFFACAISMLLVMVDCGLEPSLGEKTNIISKLPIPLLLVSPIFLSALIPSKFKKISLTVRILSSVLLLFPLLATINNTISFIKTPEPGFDDILFGPISACLVVTMLVLLFLSEAKHLIKSSSCSLRSLGTAKKRQLLN